MTTPRVDSLVDDYLARLTTAAQSLPPERRVELLEGITEHLQAARAAGAAADEAAVRTLLDRLGEPEEIVAAALEDGLSSPGSGAYVPRYPAAGPHVASPPSLVLEACTLAMLTVGSLLPVLGWLVGVALLWSSKRWRPWEKLLGTLIFPGGGPGLLLLYGWGHAVRGCSSSASVSLTSGAITTFGEPCNTAGPSSRVLIPLVLLLLIGPVLVAVFLWSRAKARVALEPPVRPSVQPSGRWGGQEICAVALLGGGSFLIPVLLPAVGLVLACTSRQWRRPEKAIAGALALAALPTLALLAVAFGHPAGILRPGTFGLFLLTPLVVVLSPVAAATYLALSLHRRR